MAGTPYRVGIVGASIIAAQHPGDIPPPFKNRIIDSHVASLALMPRVELVGICDLSTDRLDEFTESWGERWPNANTYTDYKEMLAKEELDILHVTTQEHLHADITVDGASADVKGIFCEKPLATSLEDADRMIEACEKNGVVLTVGYTRRWRLLYHTVRDAIHDGAIGPLGTMVATLGGNLGLLFRHGTHAIDGMCFFAESDPVKVFASVEEGFEDWEAYKGVGGPDSQDDPGVTGYILFRNGVRGIYNGTKRSLRMNSLQLSGPDGQIYFHLNDRVARLTTIGPGRNDFQRRNLVPNEYQVHAMVAAFEELIDIIEKGVTSISPAREGRKTVQIMEGFLRSQQEGGRLIDVPA